MKLARIILKIFSYILYLVVGLIALLALAIRFQRPELTETELIIEYGAEYALLALAAMTLMFIANEFRTMK